MEKIPTHKREYPISRIIGVPPEREAGIREAYGDRFIRENPKSWEKKHPAELDNLIVNINRELKEFLAGYGLESITVPPFSVHIWDHSKPYPEESDEKNKAPRPFATYRAHEQYIFMGIDFINGNKMHFVQALIHEMIHVNSFISFEKISPPRQSDEKLTEEAEEDELRVGARRVGFSVKISGAEKDRHFNFINEAITEILTKKFFGEYVKKSLELQDEYRELQAALDEDPRLRGNESAVQKARNDVAWLSEGNPARGGERQFMSYAYPKDRAKLEKLVDDLYAKNQASFPSWEEVFNLFVQGALTGKLLPIARLVEKTYGKGSFRELGKETSKKAIK